MWCYAKDDGLAFAAIPGAHARGCLQFVLYTVANAACLLPPPRPSPTGEGVVWWATAGGARNGAGLNCKQPLGAVCNSFWMRPLRGFSHPLPDPPPLRRGGGFKLQTRSSTCSGVGTARAARETQQTEYRTYSVVRLRARANPSTEARLNGKHAPIPHRCAAAPGQLW